MRKHSYLTALALTVALGGAGVAAHAAAQPPRPDAPRREQGDSTARGRRDGRGPRGGRGPEGAMLRGITLTDAQRQKLDVLRQEEQQRMQAERARQLTAVRSVLTSEQQKQFDANRAQLETRMKERGGR
jgi:Spy/CpxP family protein refolding chaperone